MVSICQTDTVSDTMSGGLFNTNGESEEYRPENRYTGNSWINAISDNSEISLPCDRFL